jgi:regulator of sirC expression with transglutaminase-like and TPR domain
MIKKLFCYLFLLPLFLFSWGHVSARNAIYKSLDPKSLSELLAFYELYPKTAEGSEALKRAWLLLDPEKKLSQDNDLHLPAVKIDPLIALVNPTKQEEAPSLLQSEDLSWIQKISSNLANRQLKTFGCWKESDFLNAEGSEIDIARALLIALWGEGEEQHQRILSYEASLDLMALQIKSRLRENANCLEKIHAMNQFIFIELGFRFPPHSIYAKNIDTYTFLPSVMDNRKGVCLGVSILYLCIAQRLDLPLEIITPPGHIFVRYNDGKQIINIETTARGIDIPTEHYMGIETKQLQKRTLKETVGLAFANQASVLWMQKNYEGAISLYEKTLQYNPNDPLIWEFLAYNYLLIGKKKEGEKILTKIAEISSKYSTSKNILIEDFLKRETDESGIETIFLHVDENRLSILEKQLQLISVLKKFPRFRAGLLQLATSYLQIGREKEATSVLKRYQAIDPQSPLVNYYLSELSLQRHDYHSAWEFFYLASSLLKAQNHFPKVLKNLRMTLNQISPPSENNS